MEMEMELELELELVTRFSVWERERERRKATADELKGFRAEGFWTLVRLSNFGNRQPDRGSRG